MRSKKTLALLLAASMVFTMNTSVFAGVKAASDSDEKVITQSADSHSENVEPEPEKPGKKTITADDIATDKDGNSKIDAKDAESVEIGTDTLKGLLDNKDVKKAEIVLKDATLTLPRAAIESVLKSLEAAGITEFNLGADLSDVDDSYAAEIEKEFGVKGALQELYVTLTNSEYDYDSVETSALGSHFVDFAEPIAVEFAASDATKALKTGFVYALNSGEEVDSDDVTDSKVNFEASYLDSATSFVVAKEQEKKGWVSANFTNIACTYSKEGKYEFVDDEDRDLGIVSFVDDSEASEIVKTANKDNGFKITAPLATKPGYKVVKWVVLGQSTNTIAAGADKAFDPVLTEDDSYEVYYVAVVEKLDTTSTNVIKNVNGHTVEVTYNQTPAYTGKKLNAGALGIEVLLDGKDVTGLTKFKIKGKKTVSSDVTISIKSIKGLDKDTNKALKNKEIGTAKIRPIEVSEVTLFNSKDFSGREGQIAVKVKNDTVKKVSAIVANGYKFDKNSGWALRKAKKVSVKKNTWTYDSKTKYITFDGTVLNGTVKVGIVSK